MCYAPTRDSVEYAKQILEHVQNGRIKEAENLLQCMRQTMGIVINRSYQGKRVGDWYREAQEAVLNAKRAPLTMSTSTGMKF